ncbi:MAG: PHB depolymerase family esterase [Anaerolineales bacterium]
MKNRLIVLGFALALLAACRFASDATPTAEARPTGVSISPTTAPIEETIAPGNYELSLGSENDTRDVIVHIPPAYDGNLELPLLIVLHGGAGSGQHIQRLSGLDADADEYGFMVAYPDGSGRLEDSLLTWNAGHCCAYALTNQVDDVAFLSLLIDRLVEHYAIDPARVYITGISNGGMMAYRAGAGLAGKVAGIAPIAGSIGGRISENGFEIVPDRPRAPVSVIAFHGMQDEHVLYEGGVSPKDIDGGRVDISVAESIRYWLEANGCGPTLATETLADGNIVIDTYSGCEGATEVVLVTIVDGGHAWPGASRGLVSDQPTQDISANQMMLEFFLAHPKQ